MTDRLRIVDRMLDNGNPRKLLKLIEECGKGGFGSVFLAKHQLLKEKVAVKRMPHITEKQRWMNLDEIYFLKNSRDCEAIVRYESAYLHKDEIWVRALPMATIGTSNLTALLLLLSFTQTGRDGIPRRWHSRRSRIAL